MKKNSIIIIGASGHGKVLADIAEKTGLSTATISRVNRCLKYGDGSGYFTVLERMDKFSRR